MSLEHSVAAECKEVHHTKHDEAIIKDMEGIPTGQILRNLSMMINNNCKNISHFVE